MRLLVCQHKLIALNACTSAKINLKGISVSLKELAKCWLDTYCMCLHMWAAAARCSGDTVVHLEQHSTTDTLTPQTAA